MTDLPDAIGMLLRHHTMRIHWNPGSPDAAYRVRAPALITQLGDAVASSSNGRGGRTIPGSRAVANMDALQLWHHIHVSVHGWARALDVDRRPYVASARAAAAELEREPGWLRTLRPWLQPVAWDEPIAVPAAVEQAPLPETPGRRIRIAHAPGGELPPVGRLLRVTAAAAATHDDIARTMTRRTWCGHDNITPADCRNGCWTHRIQGMLAGIVEDREIRGAGCWVCRTGKVDPDTGTEVMLPTTTTTIEQDGERLRVPAIVVRVAELPGAGPDDLWIYRMCRACGAEGWLDYTTTSDTPSLLDDTPAKAS